MKKLHLLFLVLLAASAVSQNTSDWTQCIAYGASFKSRAQFIEKGLAQQRVKFSGVWSKDGISREVLLVSDYQIVASQAALARQEMREFSNVDAAKFAAPGLLVADLVVVGRGAIPASKVAHRYAQNHPHMVLSIGGQIIQPVQKSKLIASDASVTLPVGYYSYWQSGSTSILTGGPLGYQGERIQMEFVFQIDEQLRGGPAVLILIDGEGDKKEAGVDLSKVFVTSHPL